MGEAGVRLRRGAEVAPSVRMFLDERFRDGEDLRGAAALQAELQGRCSDLETAVADLDSRLRQQLAAYALHADAVGELLGKVRAGLLKLVSSAAGSGGTEEGSTRGDQITADNLLALAKEVARVETVRTYADTALKLDSLIGDVEDAVSSTMTGKIRLPPSSAKSEGLRLTAIDHLRKTEDILAAIARSRPQWVRLLSAADDRVDRALAVLRPQAIADHRSLLVSLGWPPPLSPSSAENPIVAKSMGSENPLLAMKLDLKYCESFLALCHLQDFQSRRRSRHLAAAAAPRQPLWGIEELATPVFLASQRHFPKWIQKPEFIFALVYKIVRDFATAMDEVLQPLVDRARLAGYSCREEWVAAMASSLSTYLSKEVLPSYLEDLERESPGGAVPSEVRTSWLHLLDQMMMFDKRAHSLMRSTGVPISAGDEEEQLQRVSSMAVFCDRPDWLDLWAEMELADALEKLKPELKDARNWKTNTIQAAAPPLPLLIRGLEEYKSPAATAAALRRLSALVDRCRPLPSIPLRARFIRLAVAPLVREFADALLCRCQEAEGLTALVDDDALAKVCDAINGARCCESVLVDWCEDVFFLEMAATGEGGGVLQKEMEALRRLGAEWLEKVSAAVLRGFEARCRDHLKNKKQWQEAAPSEEEVGWGTSRSFVGALDYLQGKLRRLEAELNEEDFAALWRGLAAAADRMLLNGALLSGARFSGGGAARFAGDLAALCGVFGAWCLRPEGFFPRAGEGLKLLRADDGEVEQALRRGLEHWLREKGLRHLTAADAEKMIKCRVMVNAGISS
ncbi:unnamed protein product [Spirodela intermedia]|uniref:Uncharacterized protein n=1 Tax=Spirodela intermedia TaxID=51605 RepID=A0A7I8KTB5_SPIIN|nr:unnamed protein product [Spirodela intermedia]